MGIQAPPAPERTVTTVASHGVAYLVHWLVILLLLSQAVISVLRPPQGVLAVGVVTGLICLVWATFCLGMGILRGHDADGADLPPPPWLGVITTAGCLISLEVVRGTFDLIGSWPAELMVAGLFVATVTVWSGPVGGGVTGIVVAIIALLTAVDGASPDPLLRTPGASRAMRRRCPRSPLSLPASRRRWPSVRWPAPRRGCRATSMPAMPCSSRSGRSWRRRRSPRRWSARCMTRR